MTFFTDCKWRICFQIEVQGKVGPACKNKFFIYWDNRNVSFPEVFEENLLLAVGNIRLSEVCFDVHGK